MIKNINSCFFFFLIAYKPHFINRSPLETASIPIDLDADIFLLEFIISGIAWNVRYLQERYLYIVVAQLQF